MTWSRERFAEIVPAAIADAVFARPEEREAIIARVELGYSYEELALMLDKPTSDAARKMAQRALVRLAEEMKRGRE